MDTAKKNFVISRVRALYKILGAGCRVQGAGIIFLFLSIFILKTVPAFCVEVSAPSAILIDVKTGKILYEKNSHARRAPASTTKIMTAIIVLEHGKLADVVKVGPRARARAAGESSAWLEVGEVQTLEDILYCILVKSANDAAVAAAEHVSGSVEKFVELMNKKAKELGLHDTHFSNPHGFYGEKHYTSAYDLAMISRYAMLTFPRFGEIVKTKKKMVKWADHPWNRVLVNHNKLLWRYAYADGIKTGTTNQAGHCLVASATKNGWQLISVVLKSANTYADSQALLEYGFNHYKPRTLVEKNQPVKKLSFFFGAPSTLVVAAGGKFHEVLERSGKDGHVVKKIALRNLSLPVKKGDEVGKLEFYSANTLLGAVPLLAAANVDKNWKKMSVVYGLPAMLSCIAIFSRRSKRKRILLKRRARVKLSV